VESKFETEDMTFVTVLLMKGISHQTMDKVNDGCRWVFAGDSELIKRIMECLDEYNAGEAWVEPREFTRRIGQIRKEMYRFMGVNPQRVRPAHTA
jgi:hypothetical protein